MDREAHRAAVEEERRLRVAETERLSALQAGIVHGEWQVQVHILEVRELQGEDLSGSCDPVVHVEVMGQKQNTCIKEQMRSAVYDEVLFLDQEILYTNL